MTASQNFRVKHILVKHQYEAEDILKKIKSGSSFEDMAIAFSSCASSRAGGDLGLLKLGQTVEEFEEASLKLKTGEVTDSPVRTKFGYHLIKKIS